MTTLINNEAVYKNKRSNKEKDNKGTKGTNGHIEIWSRCSVIIKTKGEIRKIS